MDLMELGRQAISETHNQPDFSWYDQPADGENWAFTVSVNRDSGILEQSNFETISTDILSRYPKSSRIDRCTHWACGWIDFLTVRVFRGGKVTAAFRAVTEWKDKLENYPVADDEDFSSREYNATIENIENEGGSLTSETAPDGWAREVFSWLWDNDQAAVEPIDDGGGYPSEESITRALYYLGYLDPEIILDREIYITELILDLIGVDIYLGRLIN